MTKKELLEAFSADFKKTQGALTEVLEHNRVIDDALVADLLQEDYEQLDKHIEISKIIMDGVKGFNDLYRNAPAVIDGITKLPDEGKKKGGSSLLDVLNGLDEDVQEDNTDADDGKG